MKKKAKTSKPSQRTSRPAVPEELKLAAAALGKKGGDKRALKLSSEERKEIAKQGGHARAAKLTSAQRKAASKRAARMRWAKDATDRTDPDDRDPHQPTGRRAS